MQSEIQWKGKQGLCNTPIIPWRTLHRTTTRLCRDPPDPSHKQREPSPQLSQIFVALWFEMYSSVQNRMLNAAFFVIVKVLLRISRDSATPTSTLTSCWNVHCINAHCELPVSSIILFSCILCNDLTVDGKKWSLYIQLYWYSHTYSFTAGSSGCPT